jgi:polyisoprenoid-binding protein YceI
MQSDSRKGGSAMSTSSATAPRTAIPAGTWQVDPVHSKVGFAVKHMGVATVRGEFLEFDGALEVGEDLDSSRAYGTVKAVSISTNQEQRDDHLRSADFLNVELHPELCFESKRIEAIDEEGLRIVGDLTINGVTREIELRAEVLGTDLGFNDEERIGLEATGELSRRDFGMRFNQALGTGNAVVANKVKLELDIAAIKQRPSGANGSRPDSDRSQSRSATRDGHINEGHDPAPE